jgi:hypothetical protein
LVDRQKDPGRIEIKTLQTRTLFPLLLTFCVTGFSLLLLLVVAKPFAVSLPQAQATPVQQATPVEKEQPNLFSQHFFGGFGINQPAEVKDAASDGVQIDFHYGMPAEPNDPLGKALATNRMKLVDSALWDLLGTSHCYDIAASSRGPCVDTLLANAKQHLLESRDNSLVEGYWILDDYPGDVKTILPQLTSLVHQYAPGKPTICGFGGELYPGGGFYWNEETASNFSSEGCDLVALYLYPSAEHTNTQCSDFIQPPDVQGPGVYDWTMSRLLPAAFASLEQRGWNPQRTPWIGISYAFAGCRKDLNNTAYQVIPTVSNMETQALSFCKAGAQGIVWYGWEDSTINIFPDKSPQMKEGVQMGMKACKAYWNHTSLTPSTHETALQ